MKISTVSLILTLTALLLGLLAGLTRGTMADVQALGHTLILASAIVLAGLIIASAIDANSGIRN